MIRKTKFSHSKVNLFSAGIINHPLNKQKKKNERKEKEEKKEEKKKLQQRGLEAGNSLSNIPIVVNPLFSDALSFVFFSSSCPLLPLIIYCSGKLH